MLTERIETSFRGALGTYSSKIIIDLEKVLIPNQIIVFIVLHKTKLTTSSCYSLCKYF